MSDLHSSPPTSKLPVGETEPDVGQAVDEIVQDLRSAVDRALAIAEARVRALASASPTSACETLRMIDVGPAGMIANLTDDSIRRLCRDHPFGTPGGFGLKRAGRWQIVEEPFRAFLNAVRV